MYKISFETCINRKNPVFKCILVYLHMYIADQSFFGQVQPVSVDLVKKSKNLVNIFKRTVVVTSHYQ